MAKLSLLMRLRNRRSWKKSLLRPSLWRPIAPYLSPMLTIPRRSIRDWNHKTMGSRRKLTVRLSREILLSLVSMPFRTLSEMRSCTLFVHATRLALMSAWLLETTSTLLRLLLLRLVSWLRIRWLESMHAWMERLSENFVVDSESLRLNQDFLEKRLLNNRYSERLQPIFRSSQDQHQKISTCLWLVSVT